jgi:hypothetical protein
METVESLENALRYDRLMEISAERLTDTDYYPQVSVMSELAVMAMRTYGEVAGQWGEIDDRGQSWPSRYRKQLKDFGVVGVNHGMAMFGRFGRENDLKCVPWILSPEGHEAAEEIGWVMHRHASDEFFRTVTSSFESVGPEYLRTFAVNRVDQQPLVIMESYTTKFPDKHLEALVQAAQTLTMAEFHLIHDQTDRLIV